MSDRDHPRATFQPNLGDRIVTILKPDGETPTGNTPVDRNARGRIIAELAVPSDRERTRAVRKSANWANGGIWAG